MFISGKVSERIVARGRPGVVLVAWEYVVGSGIVGLGGRAGYSGAFAVPQFAVPEVGPAWPPGCRAR